MMATCRGIISAVIRWLGLVCAAASVAGIILFSHNAMTIQGSSARGGASVTNSRLADPPWTGPMDPPWT
jgi:hypothetical protein